MDSLEKFTASLEGETDLNPTVKRWLNNSKLLKLQVSEGVIFLCAYYDRIPEQAKPEYARALIEVLGAKDLAPDFMESYCLVPQVADFANYLMASEIPSVVEQGEELRQAAYSYYGFKD